MCCSSHALAHVPNRQVKTTIAIQHLSTLANKSVVKDTMQLLCEDCWLNSTWMPSLRLYQVSIGIFPQTHTYKCLSIHVHVYIHTHM